MAISRGSIHHSLQSDFCSLISSLRPRPSHLCTASEDIKNTTCSFIQSYFGVQKAQLFPYARTAFYAILSSMSLEPGSEILMTPFNIHPMLDVVVALRLKPVFVDIELSSYGPNLDELGPLLQRRPACFLMTYLFGYVPDVGQIVKLCSEYNVPLIEDISQNIGSTFKGQYLGTFGYASFYSASLTKYVDAYNGAFALTNCPQLHSSLSKFTTEKLVAPSPSRLRNIIAKTLVWNLSLSLSFFGCVTLPLLKILRFFKPALFEKILGPSIDKANTSRLPDYCFEDISLIQCIKITKYLSRLDCLLLNRRRMAELVAQAFNYNIAQSKLNESSFWQFVHSVQSVQKARSVLLAHGIETGTTNLPNLAAGSNFVLPNASILKSTRIFIPMHDKLSLADYHKMANLINSKDISYFDYVK